MNARVATLIPLTCLSLTLAACGGDSESDFADSDFGDDEYAETGDQEPADEPKPDAGGEGDEGGGGGSGEEPEPEPCESQSFSLANLTPNVMLVLDKSGSMNQFVWDDDGDPNTAEVTRWHTLHAVVSELVSAHEEVMNIGVTLFPSLEAEVESGTYEGACLVSELPEVSVGPSNAEAVLAAIPADDDMDFAGATPATAGMVTASASLDMIDAQLPRAIIFVTDGAANCASPDNFVTKYDTKLEATVADIWQASGIPTFVVGIDIGEDGGAVEVNPRKALETLAWAGGVPNEGEVGFYDATTPEALQQALQEVTDRVGCQIELELDAEQFAGMIIDVEGQAFGELGNCEDGDGWVQIDPVNQPTMIELCNGACAAVAEAGAAEAVPSCG